MAERQEVIPVRLPYPEEAAKYGYTPDVWRVLVEAIFPAAQSVHAVTLALAYCKARGLDVLKKPVHIVPIWDSKRGALVETIWPGIGELRITAARTKSYAGKDATEFGPNVTQTFTDAKGSETVTFPSWARLTVYKMIEGQKCAFVGPMVYWLESYATRKHDSDVPNTMWKDRPSGQLEKCAEAASLRAAYPEEIGGDIAAEEINTFRATDVTPEGHEVGKVPGGPKRKSEKAAAPAPAPEQAAPPAEAPTREPDPPPAPPKPNGTTWRGKIKSCNVKKKGKRATDGAEYTIFLILTVDGRSFETFNEDQADLASTCAGNGEECIIGYVTDQYGDKAKSIETAGGA
jgi:phage recombination protein Bet